MLEANGPLHGRLEAFDFDRDISPAFVDRLARENAWSRGYAQRVCAEYKRFAFLALTAGHPCSPSDQVDQAWHLHLLHTGSYWEHFCGEVLERPLHHSPARGGPEETAKFRAQYGETIESYRACFGREPPRDIWPSPAKRFSLSHVRLDRTRYWLVPKRIGRVPVRASLVVAWLATLFIGGELIQRASPFELSGHAFLWLFLKVWVVSLAAVAALRRFLPRRATEVALHPYEVAYLSAGHQEATNAAVASLVEQGNLSVDHASRRFRLAQADRPFGQAIEGVILDRCAQHPDGVRLRPLYDAVHGYDDQLRYDAERAGLLFTELQRRICLLVALIAPVLGAIKILIGLSIGKPVGFLIMLTGIAVVVAFAMHGNMRATAAGKAWLARMRANHPFEHDAQGRPQLAQATPVELGVALFGISVLAGSPLAEAMPTFQAQDGGDVGGCSGDDTGCGCGGCGGGCD